ncbi:MAG: MBL fold metallo-hydrolase [Candidatus Aminicenantes bacterium]|nr:MBL fold metallo-hydrolase [Candidatus Aminicenantes bacterium]
MVKKREYEFITDNVAILYDDQFPLYIVMGEKNFLIDSGTAPRAPEALTHINDFLDGTGSNQDKKIDALLLTHSHWDHTGGAFFLQQEYGFNVICSQRAADLLAMSKVITVIERMNREYKELIKASHDVPVAALQNIQPVKAGDTIRVAAGSCFEVLETPGHTRCSISFYLRPGKILFPGDALGLMDRCGCIRPVFFSSYLQYEESLKKLGSLDVEVVAFPHNKFIDGKENVKKLFADSLDQAQSVRDHILRLLEDEPDPVRVAAAVGEQDFARTSFIGSRESLLENIGAMVKITAREFSANK